MNEEAQGLGRRSAAATALLATFVSLETPTAMTSPADLVKVALENHGCQPKQLGSGWTSRCPAHDDRTPSLSISQGKDGQALLHCHAGCSIEAIVAALGLEMKDLFPTNGSKRQTISATYDYTDKDGNLLSQVVRLEPKSFRQRRPDGSGGWVWNLRGVDRVLYRLPEVLEAVHAGRWVWIVEGEKDADNLVELDFTATCNPGGAKKWRSEYSEYLSGANLVIVPDRDEAGAAHRDQVIASVHPVATRLLALDLPGSEKDISDWIHGRKAAGKDSPEISQELQTLVRQCQPWGRQEETPPVEFQPFQPLPSSTREVAPELPLDMVPDPLRAFVADNVERLQVPPEFVAVPLILSLSAVIGRSVCLQPKVKDDGFLVFPNLWGALVSRPGTLKTPAIGAALEALHHLEHSARSEWQQAEKGLAARLAEMKIRERSIAQELKDNHRGKKGLREHPAIREDLADCVTSIQEMEEQLRQGGRRFIVNDATTEKLAEILVANPRGLLLFRDELIGWFRSLDRDDRKGDRAFYLEAWNGNGGHSYDRIRRGSIYVPYVCISVFGSIQPGPLEQYVAGALTGGRDADGLIQRFQLMVWPEDRIHWEQVDTNPDKEAQAQIRRIFQSLADLQVPLPSEEARCKGDDDRIPNFRFSGAAQGLFDQWWPELNRRLVGPELKATPALEAHLAKFRSLMPSLALIFHLASAVVQPSLGPEVSVKATGLALDWCDYLEAHARKVYHEELHPEDQPARALAERIKDGDVADEMPLREIYRNGWAHLGSSDQLRAALSVLEPLGWCLIERRAPEGGGRPSPTLRINPLAWSEGAPS